MAKKKRAKKRTVKKTAVSTKNKLNLAWKNFILFLILFIVSWVLYSMSSNALFINFFAIISMITGFVAFAFLIVLLVLWVLKISKK
jgi:hypothetical protein